MEELRPAEEAPGVPARGVGFGKVADAAVSVAGVALCLALGFLAFNQPWVSDDFTNAVFIRGNPGLLASVAYYYRTWTGRFSSSALSWLAAEVRPAYGVLLWAALLALVVMTFALARGRFPRPRRHDLYVLAIVLVAYWYGMPALEETVFWTTGSTVYLWPATLTLLFLYPYRRWDAVRRPAGALETGAKAVGMLVLGAWVGGAQEQVFVACLLFLAVIAATASRTRALSSIPMHLHAGALGLVAAGVISLVAPGNGERMSEVPAVGVFGTVLASVKLLVRIAVEWLPPLVPWLLCLALLAVPLVASSRRASRQPIHQRWWMWLVLGVSTITPLLVAPYFGAERTIMFLAVFLTVAVVALGEDSAGRVIERLPTAWASATLAVVLLVAACDVGLGGAQASSLKRAQQARAVVIARQMADGVVDVRVPRLADEPPRRGVIWGDGTADPAFWVNGVMANWYGVNSLVVTDEQGTAEDQ